MVRSIATLQVLAAIFVALQDVEALEQRMLVMALVLLPRIYAATPILAQIKCPTEELLIVLTGTLILLSSTIKSKLWVAATRTLETERPWQTEITCAFAT